jgi:peptidoglycan/LPS O-acetylase OafA/YrhL
MSVPVETKASETAPRYPVLDALRIVLAFWVAVGHYGNFPLFAGADETTRFGRFLIHGWDSVVFGTPAVIVFFVISGFCIHLPFRGDKKLEVGRYYLRRYTRILIPVAGALCVYRLFGERLRFWGEHSILWESPLWSLLCEEVYYAAYPLLRVIRNRVGWKVLLPTVFAASVALAATQFHARNFHDFGPLGTSLILLPVWLLGCVLAEQAGTLPALDSTYRIWMWRFAIWLGCWTVEMLHFKGGVAFTQTMAWFGVLAYFWVKNEISYSQTHAPNARLVAAGAWSYSLYLVHTQGLALYARLGIPTLGYALEWICRMVLALATAYLFYILVERPSHQLARRLSTRRKAPIAEIEKPVYQT